jgi:hypothetical protein
MEQAQKVLVIPLRLQSQLHRAFLQNQIGLQQVMKDYRKMAMW